MRRSLSETAKKIIKENIYCVIATASRKGTPWISPVRFYFDKEFTLYWVSEKEAKHSRLIKENPEVAIVIFDSRAPEGEGNGVYIEGKAFEVSQKELPDAVKLIKSKYEKHRKPEDYTGISPRRMFKVLPRKAWMLADPIEVKGHPIDRRIQVHLA